jgi:hypothetical protein
VAADHHVVALVLGKRPAEHAAHVVGEWVAVDRQVVTVHRVEVVEPQRKGRAEHSVHPRTQQALRMERHQHLKGHLVHHAMRSLYVDTHRLQQAPGVTALRKVVC